MLVFEKFSLGMNASRDTKGVKKETLNRYLTTNVVKNSIILNAYCNIPKEMPEILTNNFFIIGYTHPINYFPVGDDLEIRNKVCSIIFIKKVKALMQDSFANSLKSNSHAFYMGLRKELTDFLKKATNEKSITIKKDEYDRYREDVCLYLELKNKLCL